jgi:hypothetical protein
MRLPLDPEQDVVTSFLTPIAYETEVVVQTDGLDIALAEQRSGFIRSADIGPAIGTRPGIVEIDLHPRVIDQADAPCRRQRFVVVKMLLGESAVA